MVKRLIVKIILEVASSLGKSAIRAYQETVKKQGGGGAKPMNPFAEFVNQTMQAANLAHRPMNKSDALKILHLENKEVTPEAVLQQFWKQFHKNDPVKGGSFYLQSMIFNAKNEIMKEFPDFDEKSTLAKFEEEKKEAEKEQEKSKEEKQKQQ